MAALVTAHNTRGLALMEIGRFNDAIEDFTFVIQRSPKIAGYFDNRQNAFRRSGRLDDALQDANEAIRLAPTYSFAFHGRANVYADMAKYDLAVLDYDQAIRLAPTTAVSSLSGAKSSAPNRRSIEPLQMSPTRWTSTKSGRMHTESAASHTG